MNNSFDITNFYNTGMDLYLDQRRRLAIAEAFLRVDRGWKQVVGHVDIPLELRVNLEGFLPQYDHFRQLADLHNEADAQVNLARIIHSL